MDFDFKLPELGRPASSRPQRVAEAIKNELTLLLLQRVADPRLKGAAVSRVDVSQDLKTAKIYITAASQAESVRTMDGIKRAKGFFRSHLARVLNLRYTPELIFYYDNIVEEVQRVEQLLTELEHERRRGPA